MRKISLLLFSSFLIANHCYAVQIFETENFVLSMDSYFRNDLISLKNVVDLNSSNSDDTTTYIGIDYSLGASLEFKNGGPQFYLKLERNGPYDYSAPLFVHNTLMTSGGVIEAYRNDELLPQLEEFWLDVPLEKNLGFKIGLYTYEVGNGFSLNGNYENYGLTIYRESEDFSWNIYYCRPDLVYKNHLGPRIRQEQEQDIQYNHNAANFFAADLKFQTRENTFEPYIGLLSDYTSEGKRDNYFSAPIKRDILGTVGFAWGLEQDNLSLNTELAHNFGQAKSSDPRYKDISHTGYTIYLDIDYRLDKFIPTLEFLLCSGNKLTLDMASNADTTLTSGKNRAFSYFSPLNNYLGDSIATSHSDICPMVAMGSGNGLNYGVPRPGTFYSSDFDNIIIASLGFDFDLTSSLCIGLYAYYLRSFEKAVGMLNNQAKYLSAELGNEIDLFLDYQLTDNVLISFSSGFFIPGKYYKEERDDTDGSLFSPFVRGDGDADCAYQIELALEFNF